MRRPVLNISTILGLALLILSTAAFDDDCGSSNTSDDKQRVQQEKILDEGTSAVGMPNIKNFREKKMAKMIIEMRDQDNLATYTYLKSEVDNKICLYGNSLGYGLPYATQFTNPQKLAWPTWHESAVIAQADPNGLFSPASAEGTWIMMKDPDSDKVEPEYVEHRVIVSQFKRKGVPSCWPSQ